MLLELDERDKMFQEVQLISQQLEKVMDIIGEIATWPWRLPTAKEKPWYRLWPHSLNGRNLP